MLQKEVVSPGKCNKMSPRDSSRHLTPRIDGSHKVSAYMHDESGNAHLRKQFAHVEICYDFKVSSCAFG